MQNTATQNRKSLEGKTIAFLVTDGFEQVELTTPWEQIKMAGAAAELIALKDGKVQGFNHLDKGDAFQVDKSVTDASADDYDGLVLPGGVANPDALRTDEKAIEFVRDFSARKSQWRLSVMVHGHWSKPMSSTVANSPHGQA